MFGCLFIACLINDYSLGKYYRELPPSVESGYNAFHLSIAVLLFITMNILDSRSFFPDDVGEFSAASFGSIYNVYWASVLLLLTSAFCWSRKVTKLIALCLLITTLLAGSRAYFLAGCFLIVLLHYRDRPPIRLLGSPLRVSTMIMGFLFLIIFKNIYQSLLFLDLQAVATVAMDWNLALARLTTASEALVLLNFQNAIELYDENHGSFAHLVVFKMIPFVSDSFVEVFALDPRNMSDLLNERFYESISYGMASSIWGLFYFVGGPLGCVMFIFVYVGSILGLNLRTRKLDLIGIHLMPGAVFLAYYASRKEIGDLLFPFYICGFMYIVWRVFRAATRPRNLRSYENRHQGEFVRAGTNR